MASPIATTLTVWHSLFLRETLDRFFGSRGAWAWLILEPAAHILIVGIIISMYRPQGVGGTDLILWLSIGMLAFFMFRRTAIQALHAVDCNKAFFAFRQVRPFDAALVRASLEAFSIFFVAVAILTPLTFFKDNVLPHDPLLMIGAFLGLWLLGLGYGMITSVIMRLIPDTGHLIQILMMPLYFLSFVIFPLDLIPPAFRKYALLNPITHGVEISRAGFFHYYPTLPETSLLYLYEWALVLLFIGMALYKLFNTRLLTR